MTEIVFDLTSTGLRNTLGQQGVLAYAVYFEDGNTTPGKDDQGNLTSVNGWGLSMEITVEYQDGTPATTRGYNQTGEWMWSTAPSSSCPCP